MALIKRRENDFPSFNDFLSDEFWNFPTLSSQRSMQPAVNVKENEKEYMVDVAAPGIDKKDIHVHVEDNMLVIEGENKYENEEKQGEQYTRREFGFTSFNRSFRLPENANPENIKAECKNGIVSIHIPKAEQKTKNRKEIKLD